METDLPQGDGVQVKVVSSSICGSDLHLMSKGWVEGQILGHEFAGIAPDGRAVAVEPLYGCGLCDYCDTGRYTHCSEGAHYIGVASAGGMAEYVNVPADNLVPLPTGLPIAHAALVEPLSVAFHGVAQAGVKSGQRIGVLGAGAIGLATAAALNHYQLNYDISARHPHQQRAAELLAGNLGLSDGYDVIIDAVGSSASLEQAIALLKPRGTLCMVGSFWDPVSLPGNFCMKEIHMVAAMTYKCREPDRTFVTAARALAENPAIAEALISHRFPLEAASEAFNTAGDRASGAIKVTFDLS